MNKNNGQAWKTKYGPRRVRHEAPTLEEAIAAAQGLSAELDQQAEIAAALMGLPYDEVHAASGTSAYNGPNPITINTTYGSAWQRPTQILLARFLKFGFQVEF